MVAVPGEWCGGACASGLRLNEQWNLLRLRDDEAVGLIGPSKHPTGLVYSSKFDVSKRRRMRICFWDTMER